jgi:histidine ammonia-lyase
VPGLQARDGLATINGSNLLTAMSACSLYDMDRWLRQAEIAAAMSLEALLANMRPYESRSCTSCAASPAPCAAPGTSAPASTAATC